MIGLLLLVPALGAAAVLAMRTQPAFARRTAVGVILAVVVLAVGLLAGGAPPVRWTWTLAITLSLALTGFSRVMVVLVPVIAAPVVAYAAASEREPGSVRLLATLVAFVGAMELLVTAADFLTLLIGWELVGACSWVLIGHEWRDRTRPRAAAQAFLTTRFGDLGLYLAAAASYAATGSFAFSSLPSATALPLHVIAAGVLLAAAAKSAQVPFAPWLFSAMAGPTPASALLHSATMVAAGAYLLIRLSPMLMPLPWFAPVAGGLGLATALAAGVVAATQTDMKKALAGSTSSQYGLMFLAIGAGAPVAAGAQLIAHAAFKALLFLGAGVAIHAAGHGDLWRLRLGRALPWTAALFGVGTLALAAVPPLGGAFSKELILAAAAGASVWLASGAIASSALTAFYAGRLQLTAFGPGAELSTLVRRPSRVEHASLLALALVSLLLGLLWLPGGRAALASAIGGAAPPEAGWTLLTSLAAIALAAAVCWVAWQRGMLVSLGIPERGRAALAAWLGIPVAARLLIGRPALALCAALARMDDGVVDAGVRAIARVGRGIARGFARWGELGFDGIVTLLARLTMAAGDGSRLIDDVAVDGAVEGAARGTGVLAATARRLQTGLVHHYYIIVVLGTLSLVGLALIWR